MNTVAVVGAGMMTKPMVDYFIDRCGYHVIVANRTLSKAEELVAGRPEGNPFPGRPNTRKYSTM